LEIIYQDQPIRFFAEGKNYIYTESQNIKDNLSKLIDAKFEKNLGVTKKLWLRKEILKKMLQ